MAHLNNINNILAKIMKLLKTLCILLILSIGPNVNAQFLKKLSQKAEKAAERAVERKVEQKSSRETEKAFDSVFNNDGKVLKANKEALADNYKFSYKYVMSINDSKDLNIINYYLTDQEEYIGSSVPADKGQEMITVMDLSKRTAFMFMDLGDKKSVMSFGLDMEEEVEEQLNKTDFSVSKTGNTKEILGYSCEEFKVISTEYNGNIWVTQNAPVTFAAAFGDLKLKNSKSGKGMNQSWISMVEGLTMEMVITDTTKKKPQTLTMKCEALEEIDLKIDTSLYSKSF
ncbi:protein of unknown function [Flavobacteriaceae bacterium MAR_2010_188]|nr:protein of unknown function [Flavobacteriaceae bacterium MAR_2010_188]